MTAEEIRIVMFWLTERIRQFDDVVDEYMFAGKVGLVANAATLRKVYVADRLDLKKQLLALTAAPDAAAGGEGG